MATQKLIPTVFQFNPCSSRPSTFYCHQLWHCMCEQ